MEEAVTTLLEQQSATAVTAIEEAFVKSVGKNTRRQYDHILNTRQYVYETDTMAIS